MGGSTIDELLSRIDSEQFIQQQDQFNQKYLLIDFCLSGIHLIFS